MNFCQPAVFATIALNHQYSEGGILEHITVRYIQQMKERNEKIAVLTAYDFFTAKFIDSAGVDIILVGDSANMVVFGHPNTLSISMAVMLELVSAVARGSKRALVVADMPFGSFQTSESDAISNAIAFLKTGAEAVKFEGGLEFAGLVKRMVECGIPVMGHIGMLPQSVNLYGGYLLQGEDPKSANYLIESACALEQAGAFSIVLEKVSSSLAKEITARLKIPTIGIGSGPHCDGQVLVINDMLGLFDLFKPKYVRRYANLKETIKEAVSNYVADVKSGAFPNEDESF